MGYHRIYIKLLIVARQIDFHDFACHFLQDSMRYIELHALATGTSFSK